MKRSRFSEEQIIGVLREQEAGMKVAEVCRSTAFPSRVLRLEGEVRWHERLGCQAPEAARGRECEAEEAAGGGDAGRRGAEGHHVKKCMVRPVIARPVGAA
jgi:putative transposase